MKKNFLTQSRKKLLDIHSAVFKAQGQEAAHLHKPFDQGRLASEDPFENPRIALVFC